MDPNLFHIGRERDGARGPHGALVEIEGRGVMLVLEPNRGTRRCAVLLLLAMAAGCAAPSEVKVASAEVKGALEDLQESVKLFQSAYVAEVRKAQDEIGRAIVARDVGNKVNEISSGQMEEQYNFRERGLIDLSIEIEEAQDAARRFVALLSGASVGPDERGEEVVQRIRTSQVANARTSALALRETGMTAAAESMEKKAEELEQAGRDELLNSYAIAYLELGAIPGEVTSNLEDLRTIVKILQQSHAAIHNWIMTDVTVSGEELAGVVMDHADQLGLAPDGEER